MSDSSEMLKADLCSVGHVVPSLEGVKNIIFDLGGVLCGLDDQRCIRDFHEIGAGEVSVYVEEHRVEDLFLNLELGKTDEAEFCDDVRRLTGKKIADGKIVWAWNELLTGISDRRKEMLLRLCRKYRLYILSNTNIMHWAKCVEEFFPYQDASGRTYRVDGVFRKVFLSYEMQLAKPSEDIFREVLQYGDMEASETLFIDDNLTNCEVAGRMGIRTYYNQHLDDWLTLMEAVDE